MMEILLLNLLTVLFVAPAFATISAYSKLPYMNGSYSNKDICHQKASCIPLHNASCFGTLLPYASTSIALAEDSITQFEVQDNLALWQGLRSVPRCWAVVQPLLCAVYMPKCDNDTIFLPSQEMCRITRGPCRSVEAIRGWPPFLQCENKKLFPPGCRNPLQEVKFNTSYKCVPPLVETDNPDNWYHEIQGCGLQCQNPFYSKEEHDSVHFLISILASVCFAVTTFTVITYLISWKTAHKYPAFIIFYINICLAVVYSVWLIQFFPGAREEIVCSYDGTIRRKQPRYLCSITFFVMYYFLLASLVWFVILFYAWHVFFKHTGIGNPTDSVRKKVSYFHISAWSLPLVLTTTVMAMSEVDGDSMSGICFVGYADINVRIGFLLAPVAAAASIGGFFMVCVLYTLIKIKLRSEEVTRERDKEQLQRFIQKIGLFSAFSIIFIISTFACHAYEFLNHKEWDESLKDYIVCLAMNSANRYPSIGELPKCNLKNKPSIGVIRVHLFCFFGYGIMSSLWIWTRETIQSWKNFFYRCCESPDKDAELKEAIRHLTEVLNTHRPGLFPVLPPNRFTINGMNLDRISIASRDISSSWNAALPHFIERKNPVNHFTEGMTFFMPRQYSSSVSELSRQQSLDSQSNLHSFHDRLKKRKTKKERGERSQTATRYATLIASNRRGSTTSHQSSLADASKRCVPSKVVKCTSTGDLGALSSVPGSAVFPLPIMPPVNNRPQIQREVINPPFTHGMTDNSHRLSSRVPSVASAVPHVSSGHLSQCSVIPNSVRMVRPAVYNGSYNILNPVPYGYYNSGMYQPVGVFSDYAYPNYIYPPYLNYTSYTSYSTQHQTDVLPMNPVADSASETDFFPIVMTDSECHTDTGMRSYDEILTTQQWIIAKQIEAQLAAQEAAIQNAAIQNAAVQNASSQATAQSLSIPAAMPSASQQKSQEDSDVSAKTKTQFFKKLWPFKTNPNLPETLKSPSGEKSPHSEAPPPSPVESSESLNEDELDDVFIDPEETKDLKKNVSVVSLPHTSETAIMDNMFYKIKTKFINTKFRRAISYVNNIEKIDTIELTSRVQHSSLLQLSKTNSSVRNNEMKKDVLREKWLHASEGTSLMNGDVATEHVSR